MSKKEIIVEETVKDTPVEEERLPVVKKTFEDINVISIRFKGRYSDIGDYVAILMRVSKIWACGAPFCIFHDHRNKEERDIEVCMPVSRKINKPDIEYKTIKGGDFIITMKKGAYSGLTVAYEALEKYAAENNVKLSKKTREYYVKGPGLFIKKYPNRFETVVGYEVE